MIAYLQGNLIAKDSPSCIVDVNGVGYEVFVPERLVSELPAEGTQTEMHIYTHVREQALQLYGFTSKLDRDLFVFLLEANGVGPKVALVVLTYFTGDQLLEAIRTKNAALFVQVPGIGKKTAEKLVLDLHDKCNKRFAMVGSAVTVAPSGVQTKGSTVTAVSGGWQQDVTDALVSLGYKEIEIQAALKSAAEELSGDPEFDVAFKLCLQRLANLPKKQTTRPAGKPGAGKGAHP